MQLVIPMTGTGARFQAAGHNTLKPFINVMNHPMFYWVMKIFSECGITTTTIIIRKEHFEKLPYVEKLLREYAPNANLCILDNCSKNGPVPNILRAADMISDHEPVFISYCDYYMRWNGSEIMNMIASDKYDGIIPCYTGFHPHLLPSNNIYGTCKANEALELLEIREKHIFNLDKMSNFHSPGTYFFKSGKLLKYYLNKSVEKNLSVNNEFYCSLPYNLMVQDGLKVKVLLNVEHFCQWGTPEDLSDFQFWYDVFMKNRSSI